MEYNINKSNLSDIHFSDDKSFSNYLENTVIHNKIKNILIGPNLINLKYTDENKVIDEIEENKKILNTISRLILYNLSVTEQTVVLQSNSNYSSKSFIKKIFKQLESLISEKVSINNKQEIFQSFLFYDFLTFFTCLKDDKDDEISICDFFIQFCYEEGNMKFNLIETLQENSEYIFENSYFVSKINNLHIFYMMIYNIPLEDLKCYLMCERTKDFFKFFTNDTIEDNENESIGKRIQFINQFSILKNKLQHDSNDTKKEYEFYRNMYQNYLQIKDILGIDVENERKIFEMFFAILLLSEYDISNDPLAEDVIAKVKSNQQFNVADTLSFIRSVVIPEYKFKISSNTRDFSQRDNEKFNILQKIAINLNISEEKIVTVLLLDPYDSIKIRNFLIKTIYHIFLDKIKFIFQNNDSNNSYNRQARGNLMMKFNILVSRSNMVYTATELKKNKIDEENESLDSNLPIIVNKNIRERIQSNYIQELKNYIFLKNGLNIKPSLKDFIWPTVKSNEIFSDKLNDFYKFPQILKLYENESIGLLKLINDSTIFFNFKEKFDPTFHLENVIEVVDSRYLKVKHTFGIYLYDLDEFIRETMICKKIYISAENVIYNYLENNSIFDYSQKFDSSIKIFRGLKNQVIYINFLIKVNKFMIQDVIDDFKLAHIYQYYSKFYNYIINMRDIRENILKTKKFTNPLPKDDLSLFKNIIANKMRISQLDFYFDNGYIYAKNNFNRILGFNKNISNLIFKYNSKMFFFLVVKRVTNSEFSYFKFTINAVRAFIKLTRIYQEKKAFKLTKNLIMDVVVEQYDVEKQESKIPKIDKINEFIFDFKFDTLSIILPKLLTNLQLLKKLWKNYLTDIMYLDKNKSVFINTINAEKLIKQRLIDFQTLLFLFSKNYKFTNFEVLKKNGILHSVFTKNISTEVLIMMKELYQTFKKFLEENKFKIENREMINFENLIIKRVSIIAINEQKRLSLQPMYNIESLIKKIENEKFNAHIQEIDVDENLFRNDSTRNLSVKDSKPNLTHNFSFQNLNSSLNETFNNDMKEVNSTNVINSTVNALNSSTMNNMNKQNLTTNPENNRYENKLDKFVNNRYINSDDGEATEENINISNKNTINSYNSPKKINPDVTPTEDKKKQIRVLNPEDFIIRRLESSLDSLEKDKNKPNDLVGPEESSLDSLEKDKENLDDNIENGEICRDDNEVNMSFGQVNNQNEVENHKIECIITDNSKFFEKLNEFDNRGQIYSTYAFNLESENVYLSNAYYSNRDKKIKKIKSLKLVRRENFDNEHLDNKYNNNAPKSKSRALRANLENLKNSNDDNKENLELLTINNTPSQISNEIILLSSLDDNKLNKIINHNDQISDNLKSNEAETSFSILNKNPNEIQNLDILNSSQVPFETSFSILKKNQNETQNPNIITNANLNSEHNSMSYSPQKGYHSHNTKNKRIEDQKINLYQLKRLDDQLEIFRKELNTLDLIQAITESTSQLCLDIEEEGLDISVDNIGTSIDKEFYTQIADSLKRATDHLNNQIN